MVYLKCVSFICLYSCTDSPAILNWSISEAGVMGGGGDFPPSLDSPRPLFGELRLPVLAVSDLSLFFLSLLETVTSSFFDSDLKNDTC